MPPVSASRAAELLGVSSSTIIRWRKEGTIKGVRSKEGAHWRYLISNISAGGGQEEEEESEGTSLEELQRKKKEEEEPEKIGIIYARVSTRKQKPHLETQIQSLKEKYPDHVVYSDIASGLNFKRKGLRKVLELCIAGQVREVCVAYKDRLCRFAYDLIEGILEQKGVGIRVEEHDEGSAESELADDVVSIITVFGAKLHGARSGVSRRRRAEQEAASG